MKIIRGTTDFQLYDEGALEKRTAVALGKFDGVHIGHRALLAKLSEQKKRGLSACVFTFSPAPAVLFGTSDGRELTPGEEKLRIFERAGVDVVVEFPLTRETAAIPPEAFVEEYLCEKLNVKYIAAGEDVSFGAKGRGDADLLRKMGRQLGFELEIVPKVLAGGLPVSSTAIRKALEAGDMPLVNRMSGEPYKISGEVLHGNRLGSRLGFPTLNIAAPAEKLLPPNGVYLARVSIGAESWRGICNLGSKPTVSEAETIGAETYVYDFDRDVYGEVIDVAFLEFMRPERKFSTVEELKAQLARDIADGRKKSAF